MGFDFVGFIRDLTGMNGPQAQRGATPQGAIGNATRATVDRRYEPNPRSEMYKESQLMPRVYGSNGTAPTPGSVVPDGPIQDDFISQLIEQTLNADYGSAGSASAAASAATKSYDPIISALQSEKQSAKKRSKEDRASTREDYSGVEDYYVKQKALEEKRIGEAQAGANKKMAQNKTATAQEYNKQEAEQAALMSSVGIGESAQVLARNQVQNQAKQQIGEREAAAQNQMTFEKNMSDAQTDYLQEQVPITRQAGAEQDVALSRSLEDVLLGLNREEAGARSQAAQAALSARNAVQSKQINPLERISLLAELYKAKQSESGSAVRQNYEKGGFGANQWLNDVVGDSDLGKKITSLVGNEPAFDKGFFGEPENRKEFNNTNVMNWVNSVAQREGMSKEEALILQKYVEMQTGLFGDAKNEPRQ